MKEWIRDGLVRGLILFSVITVPVVMYTGSAALAEEGNDNQPRISVVDKRGVGQTQKEIENGMSDEVIYNKKSNTLTWHVGDEYQLAEDYTYYITFKVKDGEIRESRLRR